MRLIDLLQLCKDTYVTILLHGDSRVICYQTQVDKILLKEVDNYLDEEIVNVTTGWDSIGEEITGETVYPILFIEI